MQAIDALVTGIVGAESGSVKMYSRGTVMPAVYYTDFEASQSFNTYPIPLSSYGATVVYVDEIVDIEVYNDQGVQVRSFTAGEAAPAVEVISQSFTGTRYSDGLVGVAQPTTLQNVLDEWTLSAGTTDWYVIPTGGTRMTLSAATSALQGLFFNVKSYGALGNGAADDFTPITSAITAATALGGIVFFPPGTYRSSAAIALAANVSLMGCGPGATKVAFDDAAANGFVVAAGAIGTMTRIMGIWIGSVGSLGTGALVNTNAGCRLEVYDCLLGNDNTRGLLANCSSTFNANALVRFTRCTLVSQSSFANALVNAGGSRTAFRDCEFALGASAIAAPVAYVAFATNVLFDGCRFSGGAAGFVGSPVYIRATPASAQDVTIVANCSFEGYAFGSATALQNDSATPNWDFVETNNRFGAGVVKYVYGTDGYVSLLAQTRSHGSRGIEAYAAITAASLVVDAKANEYTTVARTSGAALNLDTTKGSQGDEWTLQIANSSGGLLTVTPNSANILLDSLAANFTIANGVARTIKFRWQLFGAVGRWTQVSPSTVT